MVYHRAGADVMRLIDGTHPVPLSALVEFQRAAVSAGMFMPLHSLNG